MQDLDALCGILQIILQPLRLLLVVFVPGFHQGMSQAPGDGLDVIRVPNPSRAYDRPIVRGEAGVNGRLIGQHCDE